MTTDEFSKLIKDKRIKLNLTQKQLANRLNVSNKTISRWESCHGYPDIETIPKLARVLGLSYDELLDGNEYIAKKEKSKQKRNLIIILMLLCLTIFVVCQWKQENKGFESRYQNKDLLVSGDMVNKVSLDYQEPTNDGVTIAFLRILDLKKSEALLKRLNVDHLIKVPDNKRNTYDYTNCKWIATMHFNYRKEVVLKIHVYYHDDQTYFLFNQNSNYNILNTGDLYYCQDRIPMGLEIFADNLDDYDLNHELIVEGDCIADISPKMQMPLLKNILIHSNFILNEEVIIANDQISHKQYLILVGETTDYKKINIVDQDGTLKIELTGKDAVLANKYIHFFEVIDPVDKWILTINGEIDYVSTINVEININ